MSERGRPWGQVGQGRCPDRRGWFGPCAKTRWEVAEAWEDLGVSGEESHLGSAPSGVPLHLFAHLVADQSWVTVVLFPLSPT